MNGLLRDRVRNQDYRGLTVELHGRHLYVSGRIDIRFAAEIEYLPSAEAASLGGALSLMHARLVDGRYTADSGPPAGVTRGHFRDLAAYGRRWSMCWLSCYGAITVVERWKCRGSQAEPGAEPAVELPGRDWEMIAMTVRAMLYRGAEDGGWNRGLPWMPDGSMVPPNEPSSKRNA